MRAFPRKRVRMFALVRYLLMQRVERPRGSAGVDWKLEVAVVPVSDIDRAKSFYADKLGFHVDVDTGQSAPVRVVQLTPPGSACSVVIGPARIGGGETPGPRGMLQLVVADIVSARGDLMARGVEVSPIQVLDPRDGGTFVFFSDPDGNNWAIQEIRGDH
jgi:catechol 2,3-dioxygenase-like lactoylglutathione lyase family enzyme